VAGTVTWETLRELAGFRAQRGSALSLYANLDPSVAPTTGDVDRRLHALLDEAGRLLAEQKKQRADVERARAWIDGEFDRDGARGLALFVAGPDDFWRTLTLADPVDDRVEVGPQLYVTPLARVASRSEEALVAAVGRERGDVFRLRAGRLEPIADAHDDTPGRHDQGGWSQARYERHIENLVEQHWRHVANVLDRCVRRLSGVRVVLVGAEEMRSEFEDILSNEVKGCLAGWTTAEAHADAPALLAAALPVLEQWWEGREQALLDRWRQEAGTNGRAAAGWEATLEAASDGRVQLLLVQDGVDRQAYQCPACGRAQMTNGSCPLDGTTMKQRAGGLDLAVHQTLAHGGTVEVIRAHEDLAPVGGLAALLRF
jgi:peptide chain release factor subunit 1